MKLINMLKLFVLILLITIQLSCGHGVSIEEQATMFLTSLQNLDIDNCVRMSYLFREKMAAIQDEPQFKKDKLISDISTDIKKTILNQYDNDSIVYVLKFPCQWQILETKILSQETSNVMPNILFPSIKSFYRVFVVIKYNFIERSPASIPLITRDTKSEYNIKEIILHCDFDKDTNLYLGWGLDSHTRW